VAGRAVKSAAFDLRSRPPVRKSEARATRALAETWAAYPRSWQADLPPFGSIGVAVAGIDSAPRPREAIVLGLYNGRARGWLSLAQPLAARLCDVALGGGGTLAAARARWDRRNGACSWRCSGPRSIQSDGRSTSRHRRRRRNCRWPCRWR